MATRRLQFFMLPDEFWNIVQCDLARLDLRLICSVAGCWTTAQEDMFCRPSFLVPTAQELPPPEHVEPAQEGWIVVAPPLVQDHVLYMAEIAAKSEWSDPQTNMSKRNPQVMRLFGKVERIFRQRLELGVIARNMISSAFHWYKTIGYSEGARIWLVRDGEWRQEGVRNIGFKTPE